MLMVAQSQFDAPVGVAAWIAIASFLVFGFNQAAKMWRNLKGRDPEPANAALGQSVAEIARRVGVLEDQYAEMQADRIRKWEELQTEVGELKSDLSFIRGKFERD